MFLQQYSFAELIDIIPFSVFADRDIIERVTDVYIFVSLINQKFAQSVNEAV